MILLLLHSMGPRWSKLRRGEKVGGSSVRSVFLVTLVLNVQGKYMQNMNVEDFFFVSLCLDIKPYWKKSNVAIHRCLFYYSTIFNQHVCQDEIEHPVYYCMFFFRSKTTHTQFYTEF